MVAASIREIITAALRKEHEEPLLRRRLQQELPQLQVKLVLPVDEPVAALLGFITDYVESVPGCIQLVAAASKHLGFYDFAAPFLQVAENYFLRSMPELAPDGGLEALLDKAFLAHRLLEEINDHHIRHLQRPLLPVDMTEDNIIVHHLLGDKVANRLDELVLRTATNLLAGKHMFGQKRSLPLAQPASNSLFKTNNMAGTPQQIRLRLAS